VPGADLFARGPEAFAIRFLAHFTKRQYETKSCPRGTRVMSRISYSVTSATLCPLPGTDASHAKVWTSWGLALWVKEFDGTQHLIVRIDQGHLDRKGFADTGLREMRGDIFAVGFVG
jgi:hypothetical protein